MKEKETKGRKALFAIAVAVAITTTLVGCEPDRQARDQEIKDARREERDCRVSKAQFYGHSYIVYEDFRYKSGGPAISHDPDCPCQKGGVR